MLTSVLRNGHFDGATLRKVWSLDRVRFGTRRLEAWSRLAMESPTAPDRMEHIDIDRWASALQTLDEDVVYVQVDCDTWFYATNLSVQAELLEAEVVQMDGSLDGTAVVELTDIERVDFGGAVERGLERLVRGIRYRIG